MEIQVPALTPTHTICMTFGQMAAAWLSSSVSETKNINKLGIPRACLFLPTAFKRGSRQLYWEIMQGSQKIWSHEPHILAPFTTVVSSDEAWTLLDPVGF